MARRRLPTPRAPSGQASLTLSDRPSRPLPSIAAVAAHDAATFAPNVLDVHRGRRRCRMPTGRKMPEVCREEGVIVGVEEAELLVRLLPADPDKCGACRLCSGREEAGLMRTLRVRSTGTGSEGARVLVEIRRPNPALAAFLLYFLPLILVGGGALAGAALADELDLHQWWAASAAGLSGLVAWVWIVRRVERRWKRRRLLDARIVRVIGEAGQGRTEA